MPGIFAKIASMTTENHSTYNHPAPWWEYLDVHENKLANQIIGTPAKGQPSGRLVQAVKDTHKAMLSKRKTDKKKGAASRASSAPPKASSPTVNQGVEQRVDQMEIVDAGESLWQPSTNGDPTPAVVLDLVGFNSESCGYGVTSANQMTRHM